MGSGILRRRKKEKTAEGIINKPIKAKPATINNKEIDSGGLSGALISELKFIRKKESAIPQKRSMTKILSINCQTEPHEKEFPF